MARRKGVRPAGADGGRGGPAIGPVGDVRGSAGAGVGPASPDAPPAAGNAYSRSEAVTGRRFGKTATQEVIGLGFDGAYLGPLVTVTMIGGSPCYTVSGKPTAWYENWMRA